MSIYEGIALGIGSFFTAYATAISRRKLDIPIQEKLTEAKLKIESPKQIILSCKFCAAPLESIRCDYCGRRNS